MRILVIGDGCTDMFQYGRCERLSPEAPVPVFRPTTLTTSGGMAINVAANIEALGVECDVITSDIRPAKTRYVDEVSNQILLRVDVNDIVKQITPKEIDKIQFDKYDAVVISDYNKGFLNEVDISHIANSHPLVFMDTKKVAGSWMNEVNVIKVNENEYVKNFAYRLYNFKNDFIITAGKMGAMLNDKVFPIENEHPVRDLSGAGDTFLAALVVGYLKNNDMEEAMRFANKCASWVVTQKGVVAVDPTQI